MRPVRESAAAPLSAAVPEAPPRPPLLVSILAAVRPRQWTKNLVILAPLLFAKSVFKGDAALKASLAVVSFCLLASGVYLFNDWIDREGPDGKKYRVFNPDSIRRSKLRIGARKWLISKLKSLNRSGASSVYLTVCGMFLCPSQACSDQVSWPAFAKA